MWNFYLLELWKIKIWTRLGPSIFSKFNFSQRFNLGNTGTKFWYWYFRGLTVERKFSLFVHSVEKPKIYSFKKKYFVKLRNSHYDSLQNTMLILQNFCRNFVRVRFWNFHTVFCKYRKSNRKVTSCYSSSFYDSHPSLLLLLAIKIRLQFYK